MILHSWIPQFYPNQPWSGTEYDASRLRLCRRYRLHGTKFLDFMIQSFCNISCKNIFKKSCVPHHEETDTFSIQLERKGCASMTSAGFCGCDTTCWFHKVNHYYLTYASYIISHTGRNMSRNQNFLELQIFPPRWHILWLVFRHCA